MSGRSLRRLTLRLAAWLGIAAMALAVLALALFVALSAGWQRERLRRELAVRLSAATHLEVRIGGLEGSLYRDLVLRDVAVGAGPEAPVRIARLALHLDPARLWSERRVVIEALEVDGAAVHLERDTEGVWTWERLAPRPASPAPEAKRPFAWPDLPVTVVLRTLSLQRVDARLTWRDNAGSESALHARLALGASGVVLPRDGVAPPWPEAADLDVALEPSVVAGRALREGALAVRLAGSSHALASAHLVTAEGRLDAEGETDLAGWLDPTQPGALALQLRLDGIDPAVLAARPDLRGSLHGDVSLEARHDPATPFAESRIEATVALRSSTLGPLRLQRADLAGRSDAGAWELARSEVVAEGVVAHARGRGDLRGMTRLDVDARVRDLAALAPLLPEKARALRGSASLEASLAGPWRTPSGTLVVDGKALALGETRVGNLQARVASPGEGRLRIDPLVLEAPRLRVRSRSPILLRVDPDGTIDVQQLSLGILGGGVDLVGTIAPRAVRELHVALEVPDLASLPWPEVAAQGLRGRLGVQLVADGLLPLPAVRGSVRWRDASYRGVGAQRVDARFESAGATLAGELSFVVRADTRLDATFALPYRTGIALPALASDPATRIDVTGHAVPVALLEGVAPGVSRLAGRAELRLAARGGAPRPALTGELAISDGAFTVDALGQRFGPLEGQVELEGERVRVSSLRLASGHGDAVLSGEVALSSWQPVGASLELALRHFRVDQRRTLTGDLEGRLTAEGPLDALVVRGGATIEKARLAIPDSSDPLLREIRIRGLEQAGATRIRESGPPPPNPWQEADVDVALVVPRDTWVAGRGANVEVSGDVRLRKASRRQPVLLGSVAVVRGSYEIQGRRFEIERGTATFTGGIDLDPHLDVRATHRVRDVTIVANLVGPASAPQLRFESDPPYPESDILALLLFGRPTSELGQGESQSLQSLAVQAAGQMALDRLGTLLGPRLPVDVFDVHVTEGGSGASVGVGRYVTKDVFVRYGRSFGQEKRDDVTVQWRLDRHWTVESQLTTDGNSGADLIWSYDY